MSHPVKLVRQLKTKSGIPITIATGSGTKWQWLKKGRPEHEQDSLDQNLVSQLKLAIKLGYNHLDTAFFYTTQPEVGAAVKESGVKREDLYITSKYTAGPFNANDAAHDIDIILKELQTDYLDLYLIHHPFFTEENPFTVESTWKQLIEAKKAGKVRDIGVSNFGIEDLETTFKVAEGNTDYYPVVNQIEFHAYLQSQTPEILEFSKKHNILVEGYGPLSPLFRIKKDGKELERSEHPLPAFLDQLAKKYSKTDAQILLRYTLQKGVLPVTTSSNEQRIKETLDIVNFEISAEDEAEIDTIGSTFKYRAFFLDQYAKYDK